MVNPALHAGAAVVRGNQVLDNGKSQPGPAQFAGARLIDAVETLEEARQILLRNPRARVAHEEFDHAPERLRPNSDPASRWRVFDRVVQQVTQNLRDRLAIAAD